MVLVGRVLLVIGDNDLLGRLAMIAETMVRIGAVPGFHGGVDGRRVLFGMMERTG